MAKKNKSSNKIRSRKWNLILLIFWIATLLVLAPPLLSVWLFGAKAPLIIISGTEFVSLITLVVSAYFGANVVQHHIEFKDETKHNIDLNIEDVAEKPEPTDSDEEKEA